MKILKKILFTILGLLLVSAVSLVGVILYAEYSGQRFLPDSEHETESSGLLDGESRLAYDENGNIAELPGISLPQTEQADSETHNNFDSSITETSTLDSSVSDTSNTSSLGTDVSAPDSSNTDSTADTDTKAAASSGDTSGSGDGTEQLYIMDMDAGLFHTGSCPDVADIAQDQRSERTAARDKILDAGYEPCPHCNP